jgi:hypothetical protein
MKVSEVMTRGVEEISASATLEAGIVSLSDLAARNTMEKLSGHVLGKVSAA